MIFILWIIVWLILNYIFWWFQFNTFLCVFAGLFIIMPVLLKLSFKDILSIFKYKKIIFTNILINFIIFPLIAFIVWFFIFWIDNYYYIFTLMLLSIIPGWWLLVNWLHHSWADMKIWFTLFWLNLFLFSIFFIPFNLWIDYFISKQNLVAKNNVVPLNFVSQNPYLNPLSSNIKKQNNGCAINNISNKIWLNHVLPSCFSWKWSWTLIYGFYGFFVLIFLPFIISRILLFIKPAKKYFIKYSVFVSKLASFLVIVYIFSLKYMQWLFKIDQNLLIKTWLAVLFLYLFIFFINILILRCFKSRQEKQAIFWNTFTRFITLWFIISFLFAITWKTPDIVIIFIFAYFVQILLSSIILKYYK